MTPNLLKAYLNKKRIHNQAWTALLSSKRPSIGEISHRTNVFVPQGRLYCKMNHTWSHSL